MGGYATEAASNDRVVEVCCGELKRDSGGWLVWKWGLPAELWDEGVGGGVIGYEQWRVKFRVGRRGLRCDEVEFKRLS